MAFNMKPYKFGKIKNDKSIKYEYNDLYDLEKTSGQDRLIIAPKKNHIKLMLELSEVSNSSFWILYVLVMPMPKCGNKAGRYQSVKELNKESLTKFCNKYHDFFETDSRHQFWIGSTKDNFLLVYDHHNVIYAYGNLEKYINILKKRGFKKGEIIFPNPHMHKYNSENDKFEREIMKEIEWKYFPLNEEVDDL